MNKPETETEIKIARVFAVKPQPVPRREDMAKSGWRRQRHPFKPITILIPPQADILAEASFPEGSGDMDVAVLDVTSKAKAPCRVVIVYANGSHKTLGARDRRMLQASARRKLRHEARRERLERTKNARQAAQEAAPTLAQALQETPMERAYRLTRAHVTAALGEDPGRITRSDIRAARKHGVHDVSERTIAAEAKANPIKAESLRSNTPL